MRCAMINVQAIGNENVFPVGNVTLNLERQSSTQQQQSTERLSNEEIAGLVAELNKAMEMVGTTLAFYVDEDTKKTVVRVMDSNTGEVIRQIPPEAMLKVSQRIAELLGILIDQTL